MVFQQYNLFPHRTALENIMMAPIHVLKRDRAEVDARARALMRKVRLDGKENSYPGELSGGQQQRVAIARALVTDPAVIFADEPTGNLDTARSHELMKLFRELNEERGITIVLVTHDEDIAAYAKRHVRFVDGRIASDGLNPRQVGGEQRRAAS
jgi:ABC-type lipoprotein export system ATPase subunit